MRRTAQNVRSAAAGGDVIDNMIGALEDLIHRLARRAHQHGLLNRKAPHVDEHFVPFFFDFFDFVDVLAHARLRYDSLASLIARNRVGASARDARSGGAKCAMGLGAVVISL